GGGGGAGVVWPPSPPGRPRQGGGAGGLPPRARRCAQHRSMDADLNIHAAAVLPLSMTIGPSIKRGFSSFFGLIKEPSVAVLSRGFHPVRPGTLSRAIG